MFCLFHFIEISFREYFFLFNFVINTEISVTDTMNVAESRGETRQLYFASDV